MNINLGLSLPEIEPNFRQTSSAMNASDLECRSEFLFRVSTGYVTFEAVLVATHCIVLVSGLLLWIYHRKAVYLKVRPFTAVILTALGYIGGILAYPVHQASLQEKSVFNTCEMRFFFFYTAVPLLVSGYLVRLLVYRHNLRLTELSVTAFAQFEISRQSGTQQNAERTSSRRSPLVESAPRYGVALNALVRRMQRYQFASSKNLAAVVGVILALLCTAAGLIAIFNTCPLLNDDVECDLVRNRSVGSIVYGLSAAALLIALLCISHRTRSYPDPFRFIRELYGGALLALVSSVIASTFSFTDVGGLQDQDPVVFLFEFLYGFAYLAQFVYFVHYQVYLSRRIPPEKFQLSLQDLLEHPAGQQLFRGHLLTEYSAPNLAFWKLTGDWKDNFPKREREVRQKEADNN